MILLEREYKGPSKLDQRLEAYRDLESGHILITQEAAGKELVQSLLAIHRAHVEALSEPFNEVSSKIEALAAIFEGKVNMHNSGRYDFDSIKTAIDNHRKMAGEEQRRRDAASLVIKGREPQQPEI